MPLARKLAGPLIRAGLTWAGRRRLSRVRGVFEVSGIDGPIKVIRDRWGVPHIYAGSVPDAFFAQGFVHAQDRFFQMDLRRRLATGRLGEAFGPGPLRTDKLARTLGLGRLGESDVTTATPEALEAVKAYTAGVNAWTSRRAWKPPIEFTLLGYRPDPWTLADSFSFARLMTWQLAFGWHSELVRARLIEAVGPKQAAEWVISYPPESPITLAAARARAGTASVALGTGAAGGTGAPGELGAGDAPGESGAAGGLPASNAWAVAGSRTETGHPILCNDPHLFVSSPSVWYEIHLVAPGLNVIGASLPGLPSVLIGHNGRIAWGITAAFTDCQDLFAERFHPERSHQYQFKGSWLVADARREEITVKGEDAPVAHEVLTTRHGPIVFEGPEGSETKYALRASALEGPGDVAGLIALNRASNWGQFNSALNSIRSAQLNIVYADIEGNIGYRLTGRVPIRAQGHGLVPAPGWTGDHEWIGWIPDHEMPAGLNPQDGLIVSANNRVAGDDYSHFLGEIWLNGYRARRVTDVLSSVPRIGFDTCRSLHMDVLCTPALELAGLLKGLSPADPDVQMALETLLSWDGRLLRNSTAAAIYEVLRHRLIRNLLEPAVGKELADGLTGVGVDNFLAPGNDFYSNDTTAALRILKDPDSTWLERAGGRDALLERSLQEAVQYLRSRLGASSRRWRWGRLHHVRFSHPIGLRPPFESVFDRGPFESGGDMDTPMQTGIAPNRPFDARAACPSYRQIIDLGDVSRSVAVHAPGQSGQLGSRHYDDLIPLWLRGDYHPMLWTREQIDANASARMELRPRA
ncbi:MAG: penicillin acylase family protein [Chloroflexi bacterium]|nr:penicillin acylase family protein [Chloroflexota bacterium]